MLIRFFVALLSMLMVVNAYSFKCYFTVVKTSCWKDYSVEVKSLNATNEKLVVKATVPKGKLWNRVQFECTPGLKMLYHATFSPVFWTEDKGKVFAAKSFWTLPDKVKKGDSAWDVSVCFPDAFSEVPISPVSDGKCRCDYSNIPVIAPKIIQPK